MRRKKDVQLLNMTPFIDVLFVVLLFFIVNTSNSMTSSLPLELARADSGKSSASASHLIEISGGKTRLNQKEVSTRDLIAELKASPGRVQLAASANTAHQDVVKVMDILQGLGLTQVEILVAS